MVYSIWEGKGVTLISGEDPPRFVDGSLQDETAVKVAQFEAASWEEARQNMNKRYEFSGYDGGQRRFR